MLDQCCSQYSMCVSVCVQAAELYRVIEEQNKMLCSLKGLANRNQLQQLQVRLLYSLGLVNK